MFNQIKMFIPNSISCILELYKIWREAPNIMIPANSLACVASVSVEQRAKKRGFRRFARAKNGARAKIRRRECRNKTPFLLRSLLHGNACYAGYQLSRHWRDYGMVWCTLFKSWKHASPNNTQLVSTEGVLCTDIKRH